MLATHATIRCPQHPYKYATGNLSLHDYGIRNRAVSWWSDDVGSTIEVKQGYRLLPTLFGLYIDEVSHYIERLNNPRAWLAYISIQILLYVDDIVSMDRLIACISI